MSIVSHPNTTQLYEVWGSRDEIYLILEYVSGGDLLQYMAKKNFLSESEASHLFGQLIAGISYLHDLSIYHRDLKHENLIIDHRGNLKIADFGMAALQPRGTQFTSACGSPNYAAPEVIQGLPYNGSHADIWSSGIVLYGMLTHRLPFDDPDTAVILNRVIHAEYQIPASLSSEASNLVACMLKVNPRERITLDHIEAHPFLKTKPPQVSSPEKEKTWLGTDCLTIDQDAIQNADVGVISKLKMLWMNRDEESLARAVTTDKFSQERKIYLSLVTGNRRDPNIKPDEPILDLNIKNVGKSMGAAKTLDRYEDHSKGV
ncbi:hypothetical protein H072_5618 [Dactylellina haptotyla CBS 200.50]|uniref:Protein kinase domain-containing protein n=1 Tax=Dactylellina haptotyla (strain CBS 200.50) TaxID=1284197 RepID=S8AC82_DACHA|nr:hypothetical protein H072_5618 [Dactylellina haptotyla CBS 200.50]